MHIVDLLDMDEWISLRKLECHKYDLMFSHKILTFHMKSYSRIYNVGLLVENLFYFFFIILLHVFMKYFSESINCRKRLYGKK